MSQLSPAGPATPAAEAPDAHSEERSRAGSALSLQNWRVPSRLIALIVLPTVAALIFAGLRVEVAAGNAATFARVEQLATLGQQVTSLAQAMEDERDSTATFMAAGRPASELTALHRQYGVTNALAVKVTALANGAAFPAQTRAAAAAVTARTADLAALRSYAAVGDAPPGVVINDYSLALTDLFAFDDDIAQEGGNAALIANVRALGSLSRMKDQASQQRAILAAAFTAGVFEPGVLSELTSAQAQQASDLASFDTTATLGEGQSFNNIVAGPQSDQAQLMESAAIVTGNNGGRLSPGVSQQWYTDMSYTVDRMRVAEQQLTSSIVSQARALHQGAARSAMLTAVAALVVLLFVLLVTVIIARSMVRPLRRLKAGALEIAEVRLPGEVRKLSEAGGNAAPSADMEPIGVHSTDEIGQVARAFDQVHREALRLAADEATLRGSVSAMFVSLSRRSQSLLERLLRLIDSLELGEEDPERLSNLFRMDHLATRMRRNSENLLVLAGHETPRRQSGPVSLVDVLRASVSEIEQYERVSLNVQPGIALIGNAVTDTVHLLAELLENATMFSAKSTQVSVSAHSLSDGAVLVGVTDNGMGMSGEQLMQLNWRLENPPVADVAVSRHMGLFAVAHLAARHGIKVGLQKPATGGITVHVLLPDALTAHDMNTAPWMQPAAAPAASALARAAPRAAPRAASFSPSRASQAQVRAPQVRVPQPPPPQVQVPQVQVPQVRVPQARAALAASPPATPTVVPEAPGPQPGAALPIFDSVESDWFRARGRKLPRHEAPSTQQASMLQANKQQASMQQASMQQASMQQATVQMPAVRQPLAEPPTAPQPAARQWSSPGDDGWRAAEAVLAPATGGITGAGLPRRTPQANLVPGSAGERPARPAQAAQPAESAEMARNRLAGFQRGSRRARTAVVPAANRAPDTAP
jgi:signal transduction histidine kinase